MQKNFYFVKIHQKSKENDGKSPTYHSSLSTYHSSSGSCSVFPADRAPKSFMDNLYMAFDPTWRLTRQLRFLSFPGYALFSNARLYAATLYYFLVRSFNEKNLLFRV